jgi:hypothetical protein
MAERRWTAAVALGNEGEKGEEEGLTVQEGFRGQLGFWAALKKGS